MTPHTHILQLREQLERHNRLYYENDAPVVSDATYDELLKTLRILEQAHPEEITPDSPTQKVSGKVGKGFKKIKHAAPMLSLYTETDFSAQGAYAFMHRVSSFLVTNKVSEREERWYCCEPKFDGLAIGLRYEKGVLVQAVTRGDGEFGEDVLHNARMIKDIPQRLTSQEFSMPVPEVLEVRGEVLMRLGVFQRLNSILTLGGKEPYVNARNAAAGSLRLLDAAECAQRDLSFFAYSVVTQNDLPGMTMHSAWLSKLAGWGFPVSPLVETHKEPEELVHYHQRLLAGRKDLDYEIDGVVYKVDSLALQAVLGFSGREPRWATAHKFKPEEAITRVLAIDIQVGRTGRLTPVARVEPVFVGGTTVSNVTLHNADEIQRLDVRVNDNVSIQRAGDVIPQITEVVKRDDSQSAPFVFPTCCPECNAPVVRQEGQVDYRCSGGATCPAQSLQQLIHFCSRKGMTIDGLGDKLLEQLLEAKLVETPADLYSLGVRAKATTEGIGLVEYSNKLSAPQRVQLAYDSLRRLDKVGDRMATSLLESIQTSKQTTLPKLLRSLGIRNASEGTAKRLTLHFGGLDAIMTASVAELMEVDDVGPTVANSVFSFFADEKNQEMIQQLKHFGVTWTETPKINATSETKPLAGIKIAITGSNLGYSREEITAALEEAGASVVSDVGRSTNYLIAGENAGSKLLKAMTQRIPVVDKVDLRDPTWFQQFVKR
jgi:DNA ligase (NAD+)